MSTLDMTNINIQICKYANIRTDTKNMPSSKNNALYFYQQIFKYFVHWHCSKSITSLGGQIYNRSMLTVIEIEPISNIKFASNNNQAGFMVRIFL